MHSEKFVMKRVITPSLISRLTLLCIWPGLLIAQGNVTVPADAVAAESINIPSQQTTTLEIGYWGAKGVHAPHEPVPARLVPVDSKLILTLSDQLGSISDLKWFHNGEQIAAGVSQLEIAETASADSGFYWATFSGNPETPSTSSIQILVAKANHHRLGNMSVRSTITTSAPSATFGFVVSQRDAYDHGYGEYLIRVIGPSLAEYQVANPLPDPVVRFFSPAGDEITFGSSAIFRLDYYSWLETISSSVGAFPIDLPSADETVMFVALSAGAYTAQVTSASGSEGDVLFEIYEVLDAPTIPPQVR